MGIDRRLGMLYVSSMKLQIIWFYVEVWPKEKEGDLEDPWDLKCSPWKVSPKDWSETQWSCLHWKELTIYPLVNHALLIHLEIVCSLKCTFLYDLCDLYSINQLVHRYKELRMKQLMHSRLKHLEQLDSWEVYQDHVGKHLLQLYLELCQIYHKLLEKCTLQCCLWEILIRLWYQELHRLSLLFWTAKIVKIFFDSQKLWNWRQCPQAIILWYESQELMQLCYLHYFLQLFWVGNLLR